MAAILVTGMSGTGKSTALEALRERGYATVDTDLGDWIDTRGEPLWREDRIGELLTAHEESGTPLFIVGTVRNQVVFYPRFAEVVLLSAPLAVMLERIATRTGNPFGKSPEERERVIADTAEVEPLLRASATVEIDTARPLHEVVDLLAALAGPPPGSE